MRVLVTGAYGLIGSACLARLHVEGHDLVAAGRSVALARRRFPYARWIAADFTRLTVAAQWQPLLAGIDAVVNCVGVLQDGARDDVRRVQADGTMALFDACVLAGVKRIVHVSAIGADARGPTIFARTKADADAHLQALALDWVILRPALVLAPAVYGGTAMLRALAACPGFVPVIGSGARLQVVSVDDVAESVARAVIPGAPGKVLWELAHPQILTLAEIVTALRGWLGFPPRPIVRLPDAAGRIVAVLADAAGWLGWRSPARATSFAQLAAGVVGDPGPWMRATGLAPQSLAEMLAVRPSNVQDRWFARLYLLKPLAIVVLASAAVLAGGSELIALWQGDAPTPRASLSSLAAAGSLGALHGLAVVAAGLLLLLRRTARAALIALAGLTGLQIVGHAAAIWQAGASPVVLAATDLPLLLAILFTLAILDER
jgi:uncharacterized protein YbjT (DUF2867 family)